MLCHVKNLAVGLQFDGILDQLAVVDLGNSALPSSLSRAITPKWRRLGTLGSYGAVLCHQAAHSLQTRLFATVTSQMLSADDRLLVPHYDHSPSYLINRLVHCGYWENRVKQTRHERLLQVHRAEGGKKKQLVPRGRMRVFFCSLRHFVVQMVMQPHTHSRRAVIFDVDMFLLTLCCVLWLLQLFVSKGDRNVFQFIGTALFFI